MPKEIIILDETRHQVMSKDSLISYLEIDEKLYHYKNEVNKKFLKPTFQEEYLKKIYKDTTFLSAIEYLELERHNYSRTAFIALLDFSYDHNNNIIKNIDKPEHYMNN